jgi:hypothetical protein
MRDVLDQPHTEVDAKFATLYLHYIEGLPIALAASLIHYRHTSAKREDL